MLPWRGGEESDWQGYAWEVALVLFLHLDGGYVGIAFLALYIYVLCILCMCVIIFHNKKYKEKEHWLKTENFGFSLGSSTICHEIIG